MLTAASILVILYEPMRWVGVSCHTLLNEPSLWAQEKLSIGAQLFTTPFTHSSSAFVQP